MLEKPWLSNSDGLYIKGGTAKWEVSYKLKEFPLTICKETTIEPLTTRLVWAIGFNPENRIIGPKIMRSMMINPAQPMIL